MIICPNRTSVRQITDFLGFYRVLYRAQTRKTKSLMSPKKTDPSLLNIYIYLESTLKKLQNGVY